MKSSAREPGLTNTSQLLFTVKSFLCLIGFKISANHRKHRFRTEMPLEPLHSHLRKSKWKFCI